MADPTVEFLRSLDDPAKFERKEGVPIWVPHRRKNKDGSEVVVTERDLPAYAEWINGVERERGVCGRITDGHVKPGLPMPKLCGYYRKARVGTFGPKNTPAVLVDLYYINRPDVLAVASERPYRSPEVYTDVKQIRGLALLLQDPFLDMGVVTYEGDRTPYLCEADMAGEMGAKGAGLPGAEPEEKPDHTPEEKALFEKMRRYMCKTYGLGEEWPGAAKEKAAEEKVEEKPKGEVLPMERGGKVPDHYAREIGELRAQLAGLTVERDQERCRAMIAYELSEYNLSPDEQGRELAKLVRLPAAERAERVTELKKIYADRRPPAGRMELYQGPFEGGGADEGDPFAEPWYHKAAVAYMMGKPGTPYERAVEHVKATSQRR